MVVVVVRIMGGVVMAVIVAVQRWREVKLPIVVSCGAGDGGLGDGGAPEGDGECSASAGYWRDLLLQSLPLLFMLCLSTMALGNKTT